MRHEIVYILPGALIEFEHEQDLLCTLDFNHVSFDMITSADLRSKLGWPICHIPFKAMSRNNRRPTNRYYTNIFREPLPSHRGMNPVQPFFKQKDQALCCDEKGVSGPRELPVTCQVI